MYVDKPMKGANLAQAIARVNRVFKDKPGGLIVDYIGIAPQLKEALATYTAAKGKGKPTLDTSEAVRILKEQLQIAKDILHPRRLERIHGKEAMLWKSSLTAWITSLALLMASSVL